jgi:hypothetical protein
MWKRGGMAADNRSYPQITFFGIKIAVISTSRILRPGAPATVRDDKKGIIEALYYQYYL